MSSNQWPAGTLEAYQEHLAKHLMRKYLQDVHPVARAIVVAQYIIEITADVDESNPNWYNILLADIQIETALMNNVI